MYKFRLPLVQAIRKKGFKVHLLTKQDKYSSIIKDQFDFTHQLIIDQAGKNPLSDFKTIQCIFDIVRKVKPNFFLAFTIKPVIYGGVICRILGVNFIANISGLGTVFINDNWLTKIVKKMYKVALSRAHHVFFQNNDDYRKFLNDNLVKLEQASVLPGSGINLTEFNSTSVSPSACNKRSGFSFLLIARMLWDKGIGEYVEAAREIKCKYPDITFCLLGFIGVENPSAISREEIMRWEKQGIIEYLGQTDDVRPYIHNTDCVVLPSYREGTPRSLLESAAMSKPIITTNAVGCKEVVEHGLNGYLCNLKDAEDLAEKMISMYQLTEKDRESMGQYGRKKMEQEFDEKIVIHSYLNQMRNCT